MCQALNRALSSSEFQFKNVEYSSGRNKTLLCYTVERAGGQVYSGYLEDEHAFSHAEEAFFTTVLPQFLSAGPVTVTCYVSSSPCVSCAASIAKCLKRSKALQLRLVLARIFQWEEPEIRGALRGLRSAGCALRMMRSTDFAHLWKNFVEPDAPADGEEGVVVEGEGGQVGGEFGVFIPWEDLEENSRYYEEKLAEILR
ncbi:hypothetical protein FKM82_016701 [Ascaphus truei]